MGFDAKSNCNMHLLFHQGYEDESFELVSGL